MTIWIAVFSLLATTSVPSNVAIAYAVDGAVVITAGAQKGPLVRFTWLPAGAQVDVPPGAHASIAFLSGRRFTVDGPARARTSADRVEAISGSVRALPGVPALPRVLPIAGASDSDRAGATRIRGEHVSEMRPHVGMTTLADATVLRFEPTSEGASYHISIIDMTNDAVVFETDTVLQQVVVPPTALRDGIQYIWTVRTGDIVTVVSSATFATITAAQRTSRNALQRAVTEAAEPDGIALLAAIDRQLGLLEEARNELALALKHSPNDSSLRRELAEVETAVAKEH